MADLKKSKKPEIPPPPLDQCLQSLATELDQWRQAEMPVRFFLRDDDAIEPTPGLDRLVGMCEDNHVPLLLASIPSPAKPALGTNYHDHQLITPAVHGYAHKNHSPRGEKTCELGRHRPLETVLGELREGRAKLADYFGGRISGLLVPPWNRIHDEVLAHVHEAGFTGVSAHTWLKQQTPITMVNTHVDIIHWSGGKVGREPNWVIHQIVENLKTARVKGWRAIGILTHHLDHDEKAWAMLERLFALVDADENTGWVKADDLLREPPEPILV